MQNGENRSGASADTNVVIYKSAYVDGKGGDGSLVMRFTRVWPQSVTQASPEVPEETEEPEEPERRGTPPPEPTPPARKRRKAKKKLAPQMAKVMKIYLMQRRRMK